MSVLLNIETVNMENREQGR